MEVNNGITKDTDDEDIKQLSEQVDASSISEKQVPKKEIEYYLLKEGEEEKEDKYIMFTRWC